MITLTAIPIPPAGPGAAGDIEPGKAVIKKSDGSPESAKVSRGADFLLIANAINTAGGVSTFSVQIASDDYPSPQTASITNSPDQKDTLPQSVTFVYRDPFRIEPANTQATLHFHATKNPATVALSATNGNGTITSFVVSYVPADLEVALTANPLSIQPGGASTLTWSVLYGVAPIAITGDLGPGQLQPNGTLVVTPNTTSTYAITAIDKRTPPQPVKQSVTIAVGR